MPSGNNMPTIYRRPVELLQKLIQFDTTNPPGNESECIAFINDLLRQAGVETSVFSRSAARPNLVARLPGMGNAPPLLLYGHVDVVTTENQNWHHPPFEGKVADGFVWGRGALDMKGGVAMMLSAFLRAKAENLKPPGEVVLAVVSDEEAGGGFGAKFLVDEHAEQFENIRYAIGEFGGFSQTVGGRRIYPIQVAEKQVCWLKATVYGSGGHGSIPVQGGAMAGLARLLQQLDRKNLPVHVTPPAHLMFSQMASALGGVNGFFLGQLLNPRFTDSLLKLMGERGRLFYPLLHNSVSPTILHGSRLINVIPSKVTVELDGRLLPGFKPDDLVRELRRIVGTDVELEVAQYIPGPVAPDMGLFDTLADILREADPDCAPVPLLLSGVTDARYFSRLGIQTYGFLPMPLPADFNFTRTIHAADERIPVDAVDFGANAVYQVLKQF